jgi:hypothetical protein
MAYTDFDTAWTDWAAGYPTMMSNLQTADAQISLMFSASTFAAFKGPCQLAVSYLRQVLWIHLCQFYSSPDPMESPHYASTYWAWKEGGDMDGLLSTMLTAKLDQITEFVGIEQAYMAAIWNAPYNHEYYSALARGFREWP